MAEQAKTIAHVGMRNIGVGSIADTTTQKSLAFLCGSWNCIWSNEPDDTTLDEKPCAQHNCKLFHQCSHLVASGDACRSPAHNLIDHSIFEYTSRQECEWLEANNVIGKDLAGRVRSIIADREQLIDQKNTDHILTKIQLSVNMKDEEEQQKQFTGLENEFKEIIKYFFKAKQTFV